MSDEQRLSELERAFAAYLALTSNLFECTEADAEKHIATLQIWADRFNGRYIFLDGLQPKTPTASAHPTDDR